VPFPKYRCHSGLGVFPRPVLVEQLALREITNMSKHTPGPWWTDAKYDGRELGCSIIAARTDSGPLPGNPTRGQIAFATAILNTQARECEANAKLIAAAPELLDALKLAEQWLEGWASAEPELAIVRVAIAKATA
jgi:hypothetical protein